MIVEWGLGALPDACAAAGVSSPLLVASPRWDSLELPLEPAARWSEVPSDRLPEAVEAAQGADGVLAIGGGSAIDLGKAISAGAGLPLVSVPTTYSGAEWTVFYGVRSPDRRMQGGGGGAHPVAIVYDVELTLELPRTDSAGTALNALAHCAEALYVRGRNPEGDKEAMDGAPLITDSLPRVLENGGDREARDELLHGAMHAGHALAAAGLGLAHAMAQAVGGAYGIPHGAMNALCLPPALEYNRDFVPAAFGAAIGGDPVERTRELAVLGGFDRLRDFGVPEADLPALAQAASQRGGNLANPRQATPAEVLELYRSIY